MDIRQSFGIAAVMKILIQVGAAIHFIVVIRNV
jgi:hypothetical protein